MRIIDTSGEKVLKGKVAVITGGGRGMGQEIAITFAKAGADIAICDLSKSSLQETYDAVLKEGVKCLTYEVNITKYDQVNEMMADINATLGKIDILINNAGVCVSSPILETDVSEWELNVEVNLKGAFLCLQSAARVMAAQKSGKIVNISSICGRGAVSEGAAYSAAKAGVVQLTRNAAAELGAYNINVNSIAPGFIATPLVREGKTEAEYQAMIEEFSKPTVLKKTGLTRDIANAVLFLVLDEAAYISGQIIPVDGGRTNRM